MLNFSELTDEQIREYSTSQSDEMAEGYAIDDAIKKLDIIVKSYEKNKKNFDELKGYVLSRDFDEAYDKCADLGINLDRLSTRIKTYPFEIGEKSTKKRIRLGNMTETGKKIIFEKNDEFMRIILPEILPRKQQYDAEKGKMKYYYDIDAWKAKYFSQFASEFQHGKYLIFSEKVSLCYIIHASESMRAGIADTDNYDTKVMTDIITTFLLCDDNFLCCNYMVDVVIDDKCKSAEDAFTEIVVCPAEKREHILKKM